MGRPGREAHAQVAQPLLLHQRVRAEVLPQGHRRLRQHPGRRQDHLCRLLPDGALPRAHHDRAAQRGLQRRGLAQVPAPQRGQGAGPGLSLGRTAQDRTASSAAAMARIPLPPQATETMSPAQLDRRARVLDAVVDLVAAGRLEDMGMKDVAERSGVALGTIYRYFSSKDHVAAAALLEWARALDGQGASAPSRREEGGQRGQGGQRRAGRGSPGVGTGSMTDRLVAILRRAVRAYQREPNFARLLILAATSTDPFASECYREMGDSVYAALGAALDDLDPTERRRVLDVVGAVWYHALVEWVNDRKTIAQVYEAVESAARLVLAGYEN